MSAMTGAEHIAAVKQHLGSRSSGFVGETPIDTAVLSSVNKARLKISKLISISALNRKAEIAVTTATNIYAEPILDTDGETIRVKDYVNLTLMASGESTSQRLTRLSTQQKWDRFPYTNSDHAARPAFYEVFGGDISLHPFPEDAYTIYLILNVWPTAIDDSNVNVPQDFLEEWDEVIESFATHDMFAKLQQSADAASWFGKFLLDMKETRGSEFTKPDWQPDSEMGRRRSYGDASYDPFVRRTF